MALTEDDTGKHEALAAWLGADAGEAAARVRSYRPSAAGRLLLCTDGLWRCLPDADRLRAQLTRHRPSASAGSGLLAEARALVTYARETDGQDNITALLIPVIPSNPMPER